MLAFDLVACDNRCTLIAVGKDTQCANLRHQVLDGCPCAKANPKHQEVDKDERIDG